MSTSLRVILLLALFGGAGCSTVTASRENTKTIGGSTQNIQNNTRAIVSARRAEVARV